MNELQSQVKLDKWDYIISASSGTLTALVDVFWVKDFSLSDAHSWGAEKTAAFVNEVAKKRGYKGKELSGAIKHLEDMYPIPADKLTNDFGGGYGHHLRDFSHHPTITGLIFSVLMQFTGVGIGSDVTGKLVRIPLKPGDIAQGGIPEKLYSGIVTWIFHLISDMAGSSCSVSAGKEGTGIPGPLMSFVKELSSVPGIRAIAGKDEKGNYKFSVACSKLFNGTLLGKHDENGKIIKGGELKFDLRTEMGIGQEALTQKQYFPVLINELLVRGFYSVRRFISEIKANQIAGIEELNKLDPTTFLPWNSKQLTHMLMISSATFTVIDITVAGIKAAIKNNKNKAGFAIDFIQGINFFGIGRVSMAVGAEANIGIEKLHKKYLELIDTQFARMGLSYSEAKGALFDTAGKVGAIAAVGTPIGFVSAAVSVLQDVKVALKEYRLAEADCTLIQEKCKKSIEVIRGNRKQMEQAVALYMESNLTVFADAFDSMENALRTGESDSFISGNAAIQRQLGITDVFTSQEEYDDLMASEDRFKL